MTKTAEDFDKRAKEIAYKVSCSLLHIPVKQVKGGGPVMAKNYAEEIEKALKLYALKQMGPMAKVLEFSSIEVVFNGPTHFVAEKAQEVLTDISKRSKEALAHYTRLKEEMK